MTGLRAIRVGITGQSGFIGRRLAALLDAENEVARVPFRDAFFEDGKALARFAAECDVIVHLAARNRPTDDRATYETNVRLAEQLIDALEHRSGSVEDGAAAVPAVIFASSIREGEATAYGRSKLVCRERLEAWAGRSGGRLTTLRIPNVFGAGAQAFDNSFIATFCVQLLRDEMPVVTENREVPLLHVDSAGRMLAEKVREMVRRKAGIVSCEAVVADFRMRVVEVLSVLSGFAREYREDGRVTVPDDRREQILRETFLSYTE